MIYYHCLRKGHTHPLFPRGALHVACMKCLSVFKKGKCLFGLMIAFDISSCSRFARGVSVGHTRRFQAIKRRQNFWNCSHLKAHTHTPSHIQKSVLFICFICSWFVPFTFILWWKEKFSFRYLLKMHEKLILNKFVFQYVPFFPCPLALILCEKWTYCYTGHNRKILFALYLSAVGCLRACLQSAECLL